MVSNAKIIYKCAKNRKLIVLVI